MAIDLAKAIGEVEERLTALRFRASGVDVRPESMLDEVAQLVYEARTLLKRIAKVGATTAVAVDHHAEATPPSVEDDSWSELLREPYFRTDEHGIVTAVNSIACEAIKLPNYFVLGRPLSMFITMESRQAIRAQLIRLSTVERVDGVHVSLRRPAGGPLEGSFSAAALFRDGVYGGARWIFYPSTENETAASSFSAIPLPGENGSRRTAFLAMASGIMSRSLDYEETLAAFATISLPMLGDWCIVDVISESGHVRRATVTCAPTEPLASRIPLVSRAPRLDTDRTAIAEVLSGRQPQIVRPGATGLAALLAATNEELELFMELGVTSALIVPLTARGQTLGAVTFLFASSHRRHGPADLALARELAARVAISADNARLYREAQKANQAKSDFLAAMSHELRTPLTAVIGYTEILQDEIVGSLAPIQKEQLSRIRASSEHLLVLVEEILAFARLEAGSDHLSLEPIRVQVPVDQAVTLVATQARVRQLSVVVDVPDDTPPFLADAAKVRQILVNLMANAVKFTQEGEVGVRVRATAEWMTFTVWDTGIGISAEHLNQIFDPFWQVDQKATRAYGGSGLGLAVVRRLARLMGGDVTVNSEPGQGSRFTVRLPLAGPPPPVERELR